MVLINSGSEWKVPDEIIQTLKVLLGKWGCKKCLHDLGLPIVGFSNWPGFNRSRIWNISHSPPGTGLVCWGDLSFLGFISSRLVKHEASLIVSACNWWECTVIRSLSHMAQWPEDEDYFKKLSCCYFYQPLDIPKLKSHKNIENFQKQLIPTLNNVSTTD